jgi:hypothetical protein
VVEDGCGISYGASDASDPASAMDGKEKGFLMGFRIIEILSLNSNEHSDRSTDHLRCDQEGVKPDGVRGTGKWFASF